MAPLRQSQDRNETSRPAPKETLSVDGSLTLAYGCPENPTECTCTTNAITARASLVSQSPVGAVDLDLTLNVVVSGAWTGAVTITIGLATGITLPIVVSKTLTAPGQVSFALVLLGATGSLSIWMTTPQGDTVSMPVMNISNT